MHVGDDKGNAGWRRETRAILRLAMPVALAQLGMMLLGVVDVMMVGHLSQQALASVSLGHVYTFGLMVLGMGVLFVMDPLVSQAHGAGDTPAIAHALHRGALLAVLLSVPFAALFLWSRPILAALSQQPDVVPDAHAYVRVIAPGLPAFFMFVVLRQTLIAMSVVRPIMIAVLLGNIANVFLNLGLVHGRFGMPALGVEGSAWASTICRYLMAATVITAAWPVLRRVWHPPRRDVLRPAQYTVMLVKGSQIGVQMSLEVWIFAAVSILMIRMGTVEMGGHTIAINLASVAFMIPLGIGAAAATRVGNAIGRGDAEGARRSAQVSLSLGGAVMLVSAAVFLLFPRTLARLYTEAPAVIEMAVVLLPIAALFQVFDGTQAVGCGILRGAGDTKVAMIINLVGYWGLGLPIGAFLTYRLGLGPVGLWWGLVIGLFLVAVMLVWRVHRRIGPALEGGLARVEAS